MVNQILFTKNMVVASVPMALNSIVQSQREEPNLEQQKQKGSGTKHLCIRIENARENATEMQERKRQEPQRASWRVIRHNS